MNEQLRLPKTPPPIKGYMTREKAIEILSDASYGHAMTLDSDFYDALKLAIQALRK